MSVIGVTTLVRKAVADSITANGIKCYPYDTWTPKQGSKIACISPQCEWDLAPAPDQRMKIHMIHFEVVVYQIISQKLAVNTQAGEEAFEAVVDAIGTDPTARQYVVNMSVAGSAVSELYEHQQSGALTLQTFIPLSVQPMPNMAS